MTRIRVLRTLFSALVLLFAAAAWGQTFRGGIAGTVLDATGGAVPDAAVKIVHKGTGLTRAQSTSGVGTFSFPDLPTGLYMVTIAKQGFETQTLDSVEVAVGKVTSLPVTLGVAAQLQTIEVSAAAATLETNQTALNAVVNARAVQDIPSTDGTSGSCCG